MEFQYLDGGNSEVQDKQAENLTCTLVLGDRLDSVAPFAVLEYVEDTHEMAVS